MLTNQDKSAARLCCQVAACWFVTFYLEKSPKIAKKTQQPLEPEKKLCTNLKP
jgi:hypothetical protein